MNMLNVLSRRTIEIEGFFTRFSGNVRLEAIQPLIPPLPQASTSKEIVAPLYRQERSHIQQLKEPCVSLLEKFNGIRSKF